MGCSKNRLSAGCDLLGLGWGVGKGDDQTRVTEKNLGSESSEASEPMEKVYAKALRQKET